MDVYVIWIVVSSYCFWNFGNWHFADHYWPVFIIINRDMFVSPHIHMSVRDLWRLTGRCWWNVSCFWLSVFCLQEISASELLEVRRSNRWPSLTSDLFLDLLEVRRSSEWPLTLIDLWALSGSAGGQEKQPLTSDLFLDSVPASQCAYYPS